MFDNAPAEQARVGLNQAHRLEPKVGDYWHDMYSPVCVVLHATDQKVVVCKKTKAADADHWTWDETQIEVMTRDEFARYVTYGGISGTPSSDELKDRCWCSVVPEHPKMMWVRDAAKAHLTSILDS